MVIDYLKRNKDYNYDKQVEQYAKTYKLSVVEDIDKIHSEMVADCMFDVFSNERFINSLVKGNKTLAQKVCDFIKELLGEIRNMIKNYHNSPEMEALKEMKVLLDDINLNFEHQFEIASENATRAKNAELQSTAENSEQKNNTTDDSGVKYSFAGVKSKTHNFSLLEQAVRLDDVGKATSEEIRQQTGWYRGYDNKWRYEIDDSKMEIDTRGKFSSNPDIRKYTELVDKAYFEMSASESELQELRTLEKNLEGVSVEPKTLGELIKHDELFKAYPKLKSLPVYFEKNIVDALGYYGFDEIVLDTRLKLHKEQLRRTLIHEIQHAIQHIEGFANGASPGYWESNKYRYTANENEQAQALKWDIYNLERTIKKEYGAEVFKNIVKYYELQNAYFDDSADTTTFEKVINHIEIEAKNNGYAKVLDEYYDLKSKLALINLKVEKRSKMSNQELYLKTAGEIESRDVSSRLDLNESQRKEIRPDINRTDVVFADDLTVGYSIVEPFTDDNGKYYENAVLLDTDIFDGVTPSKWWKVLKEYIEKRITKSTFIMPVTDENGNMQMLEFAKQNERVSKHSGKPSIVINELFSTPDNISKLSVVHIDEIIEISQEKIPYHTKPDNHNWLDAKGWLHRKADVINVKNGSIYEVTMDIAKTADGRHILYATKGKIKKLETSK